MDLVYFSISCHVKHNAACGLHVTIDPGFFFFFFLISYLIDLQIQIQVA